jgi:dienelactone hydrolase
MRPQLLCLALLFTSCFSFGQNVFNPLDAQERYDPAAAVGTKNNPNPAKTGLQKWVSSSTNGVSSAFDASSYKAYYINVGGRRMAFRLKFPYTYSRPEGATKRYPVMLFFHGAGEPGCPTNGGLFNNEKQLLHGGKYFMDQVDNNKFDGFLFYPQAVVANCSNYWGTAYDNAILAALDSLVKYVRADIDRLFVNGLSDGGRTTWRFSRTFPMRVATAGPSSMSAMTTSLSSMIHIPVWFATGGRDTNPSPAQAQETLNTFTNLGGNIRYTVYPELGHGVWNQHWAEPGYVDFMNATHKANPLVYFKRYEWCPGAAISAKMGLTPGFAAYEWQKDGVTIARRENGVNTILVATSVVSFTGNDITVKSYGSYLARFKRTATGAWSAWSPKPAVLTTKGITQTANITIRALQSKVLPSPDGKTTVTLELPKGFTAYQWYRVNDNALVSSVDSFRAPAGTYKARYSEQFGCGTNFSPNFFVPANSGTPKPDPAANLVAVPNSERSTSLTWTNVTSPAVNESGFEVYRSSKPGGPYTIIAITLPDVLSYQDNGLTPNTPYYYIVRAVTETGAAASSAEASSKTVKDVLPPSAPLRLEYRGSNQYSVQMRWSSSSDNIGVTRYEIYINGVKTYSTTNTSYTVRNLDSLTTYSFTVKAVDAAGNKSASSAQLLAYTHRQGLNFKYVQGSYTALPDFNAAAAVKQGVIDSVNTGTRIRNQADNYAILWQGYLFVPETSTYTFETVSDEGSRLYIDQPYSFGATPLINNDGVHTAVTKTADITLSRGYHQFAVSYFERTGTEMMELYWTNTTGNFSRRRIADNYFSYVNNAVTPPLIAPGSLVSTPVDFRQIKLTWTDLSNNETAFELSRSSASDGTFVPIATVPANTTTYTNTGLSSSTTYFYKMRAIGTNNESPFTNFVSATTPAAPGTPLAPTELSADNIATTFISLGWFNNSSNETNILVWKSTDNINFTQVATLPAKSNSYTDNAVTAFTQYYYYVMGINANGNGQRSLTLPVIAGNNAPVIGSVANMFVKTDNVLTQDFAITDAGDNMTITIVNKPSFLKIENVSGPTYRITASPTIDNLGWFDCKVSARDIKGAETLMPFRVSVADKNTRSVFINVGNVAEVAPTPWNNWGGLRTANSVLANLRDETNAVTPFSVTMVTAWTYVNELGNISGNNSGALPDSVLRSGIADSLAAVRQIRFSGLNPAMRYNLVFMGSQNEGINAQSEYSIGTQKSILRTTYNTTLTANLNDLVPDAGGQLLVSVRKVNYMNYLNAMVIEEYAPALTLLNPINLFVEAADRTIINVTWSDRTNAEPAVNGYELLRATDSLFNNIEATILLPGNTTSYRNTGLTPNKKYWYRIRAKSGAAYSAYSNRAKTITPANRVLVNFNVTVPDAPSPWNNLVTSPDQFESFSDLNNQLGQISGVNLRIEQQFNGEFTAGASTGNNSGIVPDNVLLSNYWIDKTQLALIRVTGLNQTRRYRFGFLGSSSSNGWYRDNYTATYNINGRTVYLNSWQNNTKIVYIGDVVPDDDGSALLNFSTTQAAAYAFNAGILIDDYTDNAGGGVMNSVVEGDSVEIEKAVNGRIYPNPFVDGINIDMHNSSSANRISTEIFDLTGRSIYLQNFRNVSAGYNTLRIDPKSVSLKPGVYIVMVRVNGEIVQSSKLVKMGK